MSKVDRAPTATGCDSARLRLILWHLRRGGDEEFLATGHDWQYGVPREE